MTMRGDPKDPHILIAEDDPDDRRLALEAAAEGQLKVRLEFVEDGEELLDFLGRQVALGAEHGQMPRLILLDLNMPRIDGREALRAIKMDPHLRNIPVVVLSTSSSEKDISSTYDLGVNSFIVKPGSFGSLVAVMVAIRQYWFETVTLPSSRRSA